MLSFLRGGVSRSPITLPLFPLKTVLFPGGVLPIKVFEQRYIEMTKACLKDDRPFGVCLLTHGEEVAQRGPSTAPRVGSAPEFATIGTVARITAWDMPQLGILYVKTEGGTPGKFSRLSAALLPAPRKSPSSSSTSNLSAAFPGTTPERICASR